MNKSEQINELSVALKSAQNEFKVIVKDKDGYGYKYADLETIIQETKEKLTEYGLSFSQVAGCDQSGDYIETILMHDSGQWLSGKLYLKTANLKNLSPMQSLGVAITYARRYSLQAILGVSTEEDTDGNKPRDFKKDFTDFGGKLIALNPQIENHINENIKPNWKNENNNYWRGVLDALYQLDISKFYPGNETQEKPPKNDNEFELMSKLDHLRMTLNEMDDETRRIAINAYKIDKNITEERANEILEALKK